MGSCCTDSVNQSEKFAKKPDEKDKQIINEVDLEKMKSRKFKSKSSNNIKSKDSSEKSQIETTIETEEDLSDSILIDENLIKEEESKYIRFVKYNFIQSKKGLIDFFNYMKNLNESIWRVIYDRNGLCLKTTREFPHNKNFMVMNFVYKIKKTLFNKNVSLTMIMNIIYEPKYRLQWDQNLRQYDVYDKVENSSKNKGIFVSPVFFISERDFVNKRIWFTHNNTNYEFASTIKGEENSTNENLVRINNIINCLSITENSDEFVFIGYNQFDPKINLPDFILSMTIPSNIVKSYGNIIKTINSLDKI